MSLSFPSQGILAALAIPTDARGRVLKRALGEHLTWLRSCGVAGVLGLGSTGEFIRFSVERRKAIQETVAELAGPLPVIANISDIRPDAVAELGSFAHYLKLPGVAVMPPHFFPVSDADQLAFFTHAAEASQLPVLLYNFPELTSNRISLETISAFADRAPMAGIKQSGGEFSYHEALIKLGREKKFSVFSGADTRLPEVFKMGGAGCIGGLVNFVPEMMVEQFNVFHSGQPGQLEPTASRMCAAGAALGKLTFPYNVSAGLEARGFDPGEPKTIVSETSARLYSEIVDDLGKLFAEWGLPLYKSISPRRRERVATAV